MNPLGDAIGNLLILVAGVGMLAIGAWRAIVWFTRDRSIARAIASQFAGVARLASTGMWDAHTDSTPWVDLRQWIHTTTPQTAGALGSPPDTGAPASSLALEPHREGTSPASARSDEGPAVVPGRSPRATTLGGRPQAAQGDHRAGARCPATVVPRPGSSSEDDGWRCHV